MNRFYALAVFFAFSMQTYAEVLVNTQSSEIQKRMRARTNEHRAVEVISQELLEKITSTTWHSGCPVAPNNLRRLTILHWNFNEEITQGELLVHEDLAIEVAEIFNELFERGFMIEKMRLIEVFGGSDDRSMRANNTSAFNCRDLTGQRGVFSNHSWGRAIDINPMINPYVKKGRVSPAGSERFQEREISYKGSIHSDGVAVEIFKRHGWAWGGDWVNPKDYQHFEKKL